MKLAAQMFVAFILFQALAASIVGHYANAAVQHYLGDSAAKISAALTR